MTGQELYEKWVSLGGNLERQGTWAPPWWELPIAQARAWDDLADHLQPPPKKEGPPQGVSAPWCNCEWGVDKHPDCHLNGCFKFRGKGAVPPPGVGEKAA